MQTCHFQCACLSTQSFHRGKHCTCRLIGLANKAGQSSLLISPCFPESKWTGLRCRVDQYQAHIHIKYKCNQCLLAETCLSACSKLWEGKGCGGRWWGAGCSASLFSLTAKTITLIGPSSELLSWWKTGGRAIWRCCWRWGGRRVRLKQHKDCEAKPLIKKKRKTNTELVILC